MFRVPERPAAVDFAIRAAFSICCTINRAWPSNSRPAEVNFTSCEFRETSWTPRDFSSFCSCALSDGCARCRRAAALPKCSSSAIVMNAAKCLNSMSTALR
jgi:hypothetical protein